MCTPRLVLCLSLLVSSLGFAQPPEEWTPYTPPAPENSTQPPLVPAPTPPEARPAPRERKPEQPPRGELIPRSRSQVNTGTQTALRLMLTPFMGSVAGMMGLIVGIVPTTLGGLPFCLGTEGFQEQRCRIPVVMGMTLSYTVGVSLGIIVMSRSLGGRGDGMATFLGGLAGAAAAAGIGLASDNTGVFILSLILGPIIGSVTGYEISNAVLSREDAVEVQARSGFRLMPVVGATPRGGILGGLAGRF